MIVHMVKDLNDSLAERGLRVPALSGNLDTATKSSFRLRLSPAITPPEAKYGLQYAEEFHYIGPDASLDEYISRNAQRIRRVFIVPFPAPGRWPRREHGIC
jgi:hypothetical protein